MAERMMARGANRRQSESDGSIPNPYAKRGKTMRSLYLRLNRKLAGLLDDRGATAVEYGLMVGLIAVVIIAAVTVLGTNLSDLFNTVATSI